MSTPRILILRTSAFGDIVHALPVLTALRRHLPSATIGWVIEEAFAPLLRGHADIDELLPVRLRIWRRQPWSPRMWRETARFVSRLHEFSAEIVLDLMGNHKAGILAALSLSDRRIGLAAPFRREPSSALWMSQTVEARGEHAVDRMLSVLDALDLPAEPADFSPQHLPEASEDLPRLEAPFILLHPGTGWPNKDYPSQAWGRVVASIVKRVDATVWIAPGPGEHDLAERVRLAAQGRARILPPPSLPGLVYLQRRAALVLGGDTGPVHLAHALGTPALCVMGPTDPKRHGPYHSLDQAIWHSLPCSFCHQKFDGPKACLHEIDPEVISEQAVEKLSGGLH